MPAFASRAQPIFSASSGAWFLELPCSPDRPQSRGDIQIDNTVRQRPQPTQLHAGHTTPTLRCSAISRLTGVPPPLTPTSPSKHRWKSWSVFMDSGKTGLAGHFFGRRDFSLAPSWPPSWARVLCGFLPPTEHGVRSSGAGPWARGTRLLVSLGRESVALAAWRGSGIGVAMFGIH